MTRSAASALLALALAACGGDSVTEPGAPPGAIRFIEIGAGYAHTCGLTLTGAVWCWGDNSVGQLGNGSQAGSTRPAAVTSSAMFTRLSVGAAHACAIAGVQTYCWGHNDEGQLGDGTFTPRSAPALVEDMHAFSRISAGHAHSCALDSGGSAWCWGDDSAGQLGDGEGAATRSNRPVRADIGVPFVQVHAGYYQTCALTAAGAAYCWGMNVNGQVGDGTTENRHSPVPVSGGRTFTAIAPGDRFVCGVSAGSVWCWGAARNGELGDNAPAGSNVPVQVPGISNAVAVETSMGTSTVPGAQPYACALIGSRVECWGGTVRSIRPNAGMHALDTRIRATTMAAGAEHVCVLTTRQFAFCGGGNYAGQLGDATTQPRATLTGVVSPFGPD